MSNLNSLKLIHTFAEALQLMLERREEERIFRNYSIFIDWRKPNMQISITYARKENSQGNPAFQARLIHELIKSWDPKLNWHIKYGLVKNQEMLLGEFEGFTKEIIKAQTQELMEYYGDDVKLGYIALKIKD